MSFNELGLDQALLEGVAAMGYENPTPIQEQAIPLVLDGRDVVGCAQTGTGKTAAFVLPVLQRMSQKPGVKALVVTPTRELAGQIEEVAKICAKATSRRVLAVYGGMPYDPQAKAARKGVDLLIATPGRLLDLISHGDISLSHVEILILDEADRMLDMGFWPDVRRILRKIPDQRQNLLFSATVSRAILDVVGDTLIKPVLVEIGERATPVDEVEQKVFPVDVNQKTELLVRFLKHHKPERTLIFTRTKHRADRLQSTLIKHGIKSTAIHSNRTQQQRQAALDGFKQGRYQVLVATDIVARGIDVDGISHVINYDIPTNPEDYVHRIGRTARAGATGIAVSLLTADDVHELKDIERLIGATIDRHDLPGFEYAERRIPHSSEVPRRPGKLVFNGGARRAAQRGFTRTRKK